MPLINNFNRVIILILFFNLLVIEQSKAQNDSVFVSTKSPILALCLSALIPGAGQIYNESYWKAPIVWGFIGYYAYEWNRQNKFYKDFKTLYKNSLSQNVPNELFRKFRDFYRDQRDLFAIYFAIAYLANVLDAYVDAHLYDIKFLMLANKRSFFIEYKTPL